MAYIKTSPHFEAFGGPFALELERFNIRHIEQLASLLRSPIGLEGIKRLHLGVGISDLQQAANKYLATTSHAGLRLGTNSTEETDRPANQLRRRGLGYTIPNENKYHTFAALPTRVVNDQEVKGSSGRLNSVLDLYEVVSLSKHEHARLIQTPLPDVRDQGFRGTCVAFSATAMLESYIKNHVAGLTRGDFSEQYLYFRAKSVDSDHYQDGTRYEFALQEMKEHGVCASKSLRYHNFIDWGQSLLFEKNRYGKQSLGKLAKRMRISGYSHLPFDDIVGEIKDCLNRRLAVGVGVLVFKDAWLKNDYTVVRGEVEMPLTSIEDGKEILLDVCKGGHAITIYGYEERSDTNRPGGGGFVFRNSWGPNWASNSEYARGYGIIPYEYIQKYGMDACIITGIEGKS